MRRLCRLDPEFRQMVAEMCRRDALFWINTFVWIFEPRTEGIWKSASETGGKLPFITYDFQDDEILAVDDAVGRYDLQQPKSRDMGVTWIDLTTLLWRWQFRDDQLFVIMSLKEDAVDAPGDPRTLFWKLDFMLKYQPPYLRPRKIVRTSMHLANADRGCAFDGESTSVESGTGDRRLAVMLDEFSKMDTAKSIFTAVRDVTPCRLMPFTPKGKGHFSYQVYQDGNIRKREIRWTQHPEKKRGLYTSLNGRLQIIDKDYAFPPNYAFVLDGKVRSPWYDEQDRREPDKKMLAQELDIDFGASSCVFYDPGMLDRYRARYCTAPKFRLDAARFMDAPSPELLQTLLGHPVQVWVAMGPGDSLPRDRRYFLGADIASGGQASNSVLSLYDGKTREKVAQFACNNIEPYEIAELAAGLAEWASDSNGVPAKIMYEMNGPGGQFGRKLEQVGHHHVFRRRDEVGAAHKPTDKPGWPVTPDSKRRLHDAYKEALSKELVVNRSAEAIDECRQYELGADGGVYHSQVLGRNADADSSKKNHGDYVVADAMAWWILNQAMPPRRSDEQPQEIPANCPYTRRREYERKLQEQEAW
jgi:hypothetical protein